MNIIKVGLLHPHDMSTDACLNFNGVRQLLVQEGIPFVVCDATEQDGELIEQASVLLVVDHGCLTEREERYVVELAGTLPLVWVGMPRTEACPDLLRMLHIDRVTYDEVAHLRLIRLKAHQITAPFTHEKETTLRMKFIEHLRVSCPDVGCEVADVALGDGMKLGSAVWALAQSPRRVVVAFPVGKAFCVKTSYYTDGAHLDQNDFPICTIVDVLRGLLRESLRWAAGDAVLVRMYYWPYRNTIPRGLFCTNHDLCGYSEKGVQFIKEVCEAEGVRTTFFDFYPNRNRPSASANTCRL